LGWYPDKIEVDYKSFHANQAKAIFPMGSGNKETWREVLSCIGSGKVKIKSNITDILDYSEACKGYERIISRDNSIMGMVFDWRNS
jgi:threonine dehydrogenase-like Zn-dependent dehydrogenase